jgi:hypothetical protein
MPVLVKPRKMKRRIVLSRSVSLGPVGGSDVVRKRQFLSVGMRLRELGVKFRLADSQFEALNDRTTT